jgi:hypothetical protein
MARTNRTRNRNHEETVAVVEQETPEPSTALVPLQNGLELPEEMLEQLEQSESLTELTPEDRMIAHECFNVKLKDQNGQWIPSYYFFNTVTEEVTEEIDAVLLFLKKSRRYVQWDEDAGSTLMCYSLDTQIGNWQEPAKLLKCETCPYQQWTGNGRNSQPPKCKLVWNFVGINLTTGDPFIVSAKSTSLKPMKQFLNKYFIGKLRGKNLPLYCYRVRLRLTQPTGTYAVLHPEIGQPFHQEDIDAWYRLAKDLWESRRIDLTQLLPEEIEEQEETQQTQQKDDDDLPF